MLAFFGFESRPLKLVRNRISGNGAEIIDFLHQRFVGKGKRERLSLFDVLVRLLRLANSAGKVTGVCPCDLMKIHHIDSAVVIVCRRHQDRTRISIRESLCSQFL